jgi:hypothetical protein
MKRFLILALASLSLGLATPGHAQVTGFCGDLEAIAEDWRGLFPLGDVASCPELCRAWARSCEGAVLASKRCTLEMLEQGIAVVARAQCSVESGETAQGQCRRTLRNQIELMKALTRQQADAGLASCTEAQQTDECLAICQEVEE